jgi:2-oxoglutarate ferredoxin oxidoreductase subunit beta
MSQEQASHSADSHANGISAIDRDTSGVVAPLEPMHKGTARHPLDPLLRPGRIPHIWCTGCGLGVVLTAYLNGIKKAGLNLDNVSVVSGIGCTGRIAGYIQLDTFHTTHGRALPFATGLKLANPELKVSVISGDGDLFAIGGNHLIHAARRNIDMLVLCVNNFNYGMTGGQAAPTTPVSAKTQTSPYGCWEHPFNLPYVAAASGAVYVARWTVLHARRLMESIAEAVQHPGLSFIEVISQCPTNFDRANKGGEALDMMHFYQNKTVVRNGIDPKEADIGLYTPIVCGKFVDLQKETYDSCYGNMCTLAKGGKK